MFSSKNQRRRKMSKRFLFVVVVLAIALAACAPVVTETPAAPAPTEAPAAATQAPAAPAGPPAACATDAFGCAKIDPGTTVKIGMGAPMTGGNASFGIDISQGAQVAVKDAGEFQGFKFELVAQDDGGNAEGGAAVANKLVADPSVVAIAGHIFSGATAAAMPIYEKAGLPMLSPSATNPALTQQGSKVFNRVAFTDVIQGKFAAEYLYNKLGIKKLAIMHDGSDYGKGLAEIVQTNFKALGGEVAAFQAITPGETDYTAVLSTVSAAKPEAVYFGGYIAEATVLANQMKQTGLENAVFFGCDGTYGADFLAKTGKNGEGAYAVSLTPPDSPDKAKFDAAYQAAYGVAPGTLSPFSWNGYDSTAALIAMVEKVAVKGDDGSLYVPRGALVDAVRTLKDFKGVAGTYTCNDVGECNAEGPLFVVVKDGQWVPAPK
jgi:branched-chain amino acid transport system substrate-binding protein